jgi:hypothetical protein
MNMNIVCRMNRPMASLDLLASCVSHRCSVESISPIARQDLRSNDAARKRNHSF